MNAAATSSQPKEGAAIWSMGDCRRGFGLVGDLVVGVIGALLGLWIFGLLGIGLGGLIGALVTATIGAIILIALLRVIKRACAWSAFPFPFGEAVGSTQRGCPARGAD